MRAGARLIYSVINETAVTSNNRALPTASQAARCQLVPSLCLRRIWHSCAWVGSQLDHDPAPIYAPVYLSALETICGEGAFEAAEPAAGRSLREDGHSRLQFPVCEGDGPGMGQERRAGNPACPGTGTSLAAGVLGGGETRRGVIPPREVLGQHRAAEGTGVAVSFPEGTRSPEIQIVLRR